MLKKIKALFFGNSLELKERIFRVILVLASIMSVLAIIEGFALNDRGIMVIPLFLLFITVLISLIATFLFRMTQFSAWLIGLMIVVGIFPTVFFTSGGIRGGATTWFILGIVYCFLMFNGWHLYIMLAITIAADVFTYAYGYMHPETIHTLAQESLVYLDSIFGVVVVGLTIGLIVKYQSIVYGQEREIALEKKEELERLSNSKNLFFTKMSHEIRSPINAIIGLNEINLRENLPDEVMENCISIENASDMLLGLVNEVLDLSQIETSRMNIIVEDYSTKELFYNLVDLMYVRMKEKDLKFVVDVDEYMPLILRGDRKRINQILVNLLTNAVKYTSSGSITLTARAEVSENQKTWLIISVADTGVGIKKEDMKYLYDYFHRIDEGNNRMVEGSGLGLSITKQLVELMGGQITVDSIYTKGSTFTIRIEQQIIDEAPVGKVDFLSRDRGNVPDGYQTSFEAPEARVLFVDDSAMNLAVAKKLLRDTKVEIDVAESGKEALALTKMKFYHVIFLDYMMPDLNGMETLQEIRKQENGLCMDSSIVCLTGNAQSESQISNMEYVFDSFLQKPVRGETLEAEILKFIPNEIVEYRKSKSMVISETNRAVQYAARRKKKICVTTDCICDLSQEYITKYGIRIVYLYIATENGRFMDTKEIDSNNISRYLSASSSKASAVCAEVTDYEAFFADVLTEAEDIVHLSLAQYAGKSYDNAMAAAEGFDHVHVIDSGHLSGGLAIMVLYAAKLAREGVSLDRLYRELDTVKDNISNTFVLSKAQIFYEKGYTNVLVAKACEKFHLHPILGTRGSWLKVIGVRTGSLENARRQHIAHLFRFKKRINTEVVYITHVACSVKEIEFVLREIRRYIDFDKIIVERASVSNACNAGIGTIGIAFYKRKMN